MTLPKKNLLRWIRRYSLRKFQYYYTITRMYDNSFTLQYQYIKFSCPPKVYSFSGILSAFGSFQNYCGSVRTTAKYLENSYLARIGVFSKLHKFSGSASSFLYFQGSAILNFHISTEGSSSHYKQRPFFELRHISGWFDCWIEYTLMALGGGLESIEWCGTKLAE